MSLNTEQIYTEPTVAFPVNSPPYNFLGGPSWGSGLYDLDKHCQNIGVRSAEIHPNESIVGEIEECAEQGNAELLERIGSLHMTFNTGEGLLGKMLDKRGVIRVEESLVAMRTILQAVGRPLPAVHYIHDDNPATLAASLRLSPGLQDAVNLVQPSAELIDEFRLSGETGELMNKIRPQGIDALCQDTGWSRALSKDGTPPPKDLYGKYWDEQLTSGYVGEQHISLLRLDMLGFDRETAMATMQDYRDLISKKPHVAINSEIGEKIGRSIELWKPNEHIVKALGAAIFKQVVEIPAVANKAHLSRIIENLAEIGRHWGATPLLNGSPDPAAR